MDSTQKPLIAQDGSKIRIIVNPAAGQDRPLLRTFNRIFGKASFDWDVMVTKEPGDGQRLALQAVNQGADIVGVYGGDGSVMEVAQSLVGTNIPMAIFPGGTGNVLSVELNIHRNLPQLCEQIVQKNYSIKKIDVGQAGDQIFLLRAGIGFEARVVEGTDPNLKEKYGIFAYLIAALQSLREPYMSRYRLVIDDQEYEYEGLACLVANAGNLGVLGWTIAPNISIEDGLLDVFVIRKADLTGFISLAASVIGGAENVDNFPHWRARKVSIYADPAQSLQCDGDLAGVSPMHVQVLPRALNVLLPHHPTLAHFSRN